jgi:hypothetical protein
MIELTLNQADVMEPRSTSHRQGRGYKKAFAVVGHACLLPSVYIQRGDLMPKKANSNKHAKKLLSN